MEYLTLDQIGALGSATNYATPAEWFRSPDGQDRTAHRLAFINAIAANGITEPLEIRTDTFGHRTLHDGHHRYGALRALGQPGTFLVPVTTGPLTYAGETPVTLLVDERTSHAE